MAASIKDYNYSLPEKLIASNPRPNREQAKLMIFNKSSEFVKHTIFSEMPNYLTKGDVIVLNDTKVIPGRLFLKKETGGIVELLFHKIINKNTAICIFSSSRKLSLDSKLYIDKNNYLEVVSIYKNYVTLSSNQDILSLFINHGEVPLPKYIKRKATRNDVDRYQTTYAKNNGSVAAPTAGLHFTKEILNKIKKKGVLIEYLTLHVTYNTFKPIQCDDYTKHDIGSEYCSISKKLMTTIESTKRNKKNIIAVGTTATRALENYATKSLKGSFSGEADLYITPGYKFKIINGMITNFHLPQSTLLLLVSALAGKENILNLYNKAIENNYRFYSYGDSMFIKT